MIKRRIFEELEAHLEQKRVTVLTGMRRVGKTTTLRYLLDMIAHDNKLYFDMERLEDRYIFNHDSFREIQTELEIRGIDFSMPAVIAIDEIQLIPDIVSFVKYYHDHFEVKFIITGSSSYYLRNRITESLAGRKLIFELFPLDFFEFLEFKGEDTDSLAPWSFQPFSIALYQKYQSLYEEFLHFGGFPEVVLAKTNTLKKKYLEEILNSYIELDVKLLSDFKAIDDLYRLVKLLAARAGNTIQLSTLSSLLSLRNEKVKNYLHLFEKTYFIHLISPFVKSYDREISKQQKVYFADTGLLNQLFRVTSGQLFENAIALQLIGKGELNFYKKRHGQEIDFILNREKAIEVKETPTQQDLNVLKKRANALGIEAFSLVGRHFPANNFKDFVWGGNVF